MEALHADHPEVLRKKRGLSRRTGTPPPRTLLFHDDHTHHISLTPPSLFASTNRHTPHADYCLRSNDSVYWGVWMQFLCILLMITFLVRLRILSTR